mgnify:CR=1 FL=1
MHRRIIALLTAIALHSFLLSGQPTQLDRYIATALESNIALQRRDLSYQKSLAALREAKRCFLPTLSLQARFSAAQGGRAFEIPIGDLMNPVYDNLDLLNGLAQDALPDYPAIPTYPKIQNEEVFFLRETEQETLVRLAWPVFNSAILYNQKIRENLSQVERISVDIYRRELVMEVKTAYFNYLKAEQGITLYRNTLQLVQENQRSSESLFRNHQVTVDEVYASRAQVAEVEQQLARARKQARVAQAYFNFLLNRAHDTEIIVEQPEAVALEILTLEEARGRALQQREEFQQLNHYLAASDHRVRLEKGALLPTVNLVGDYGVQGVNYALDQDSDYAIGSLLLRWNFLDPTRGARVQQARIEQAELTRRKEETEQQIGLGVVDAYYELEVNRENIESARAEVKAAERAFALIRKKYTQGQASQVELINARTQLTNAERNAIIARYDYQIGLATYERATAAYEF